MFHVRVDSTTGTEQGKGARERNQAASPCSGKVTPTRTVSYLMTLLNLVELAE